MDFQNLALTQKWPKEFQDLLLRKSFDELPSWDQKKNQTKYIFELTDNQTIYLGLFYHGLAVNAPYSKKSFSEGLWNYDVVEAFIGIEQKKYLEINLSINGAWWAAQFKNYRERELEVPEVKLKELICNSEKNQNLVLASFSTAGLNFNKKFNISAIISKQYYSLNPAPLNSKPDFHLEQLRK